MGNDKPVSHDPIDYPILTPVDSEILTDYVRMLCQRYGRKNVSESLQWVARERQLARNQSNPETV